MVNVYAWYRMHKYFFFIRTLISVHAWQKPRRSGVNISKGEVEWAAGLFIAVHGAGTDGSLMQADPPYWTTTPALCVCTAAVSLGKAITGERAEIPKVAGNNNFETVEGNEWAVGGPLNH